MIQLLPCQSTSNASSRRGQDTNIELQVFGQACDLDPSTWDAASQNAPFLSAAWLTALEAAGAPDTQYLMFGDKSTGQPLGVSLLQRLPLQGMKLGAVPTEVAAQGLGSSVFQFGQALFGGAAGSQFAEGVDVLACMEAARTHLIQEAAEKSTWLIKDLSEPLPEPINTWTHLAVLPDMELSIASEWVDFDGYLAALPSKYRRRARRARKKFDDGLSTRILSPTEVIQLSPKLDKLYTQLLSRADYVPYQVPDGYILRLKEALPQQVGVRGYFDGNELVGFATLLHEGGQGLAHFAAIETRYNDEHQLYLNLLFNLLADSLDIRLQHLSYGRTATTIKSSLGAVPRLYHSYATHDGMLRRTALNWINKRVVNDADAEALIQRPFG